MNVMPVKNKKIKKLRLLRILLIITFSIYMLIYGIINDEQIVIPLVLILILKMIYLIFHSNKVRRKKHQYHFYNWQNLGVKGDTDKTHDCKKT